MSPSPGVELAISVISAAASVILTGLISVIAWYLRGEYREHKKNTAVRRYLVGDSSLEEVEDDGEIEEIDTKIDRLQDEVEAQHEIVDLRLERMHGAINRIITLLETEHDHEIERPNGGQRIQPGEDD